MPPIVVRHAEIADAATLHDLIRALAAFENKPEAVKSTPADLARDGFGPVPRFEALLALADGHAVGFALFYPTYSTWEGRPGVFVDDLFVLDHARGRGAGRALLAAVAGLVVARGWGRLELNVLDWNPARGFYHAMGLAHLDEWLPYRVVGADLARLAGTAA